MRCGHQVGSGFEAVLGDQAGRDPIASGRYGEGVGLSGGGFEATAEKGCALVGWIAPRFVGGAETEAERTESEGQKGPLGRGLAGEYEIDGARRRRLGDSAGILARDDGAGQCAQDRFGARLAEQRSRDARRVGWALIRCRRSGLLAQVVEQSLAVAEGSNAPLLEVRTQFENGFWKAARGVEEFGLTHEGCRV